MVADGSDQGQELLTKETLEEAKTLTNVEAAASEILTQEPRIDGHAPKKVHTRNRKARAFTMSDEVHALLGALADRNGVTMSAYIEVAANGDPLQNPAVKLLECRDVGRDLGQPPIRAPDAIALFTPCYRANEIVRLVAAKHRDAGSPHPGEIGLA